MFRHYHWSGFLIVLLCKIPSNETQGGILLKIRLNLYNDHVCLFFDTDRFNFVSTRKMQTSTRLSRNWFISDFFQCLLTQGVQIIYFKIILKIFPKSKTPKSKKHGKHAFIWYQKRKRIDKRESNEFLHNDVYQCTAVMVMWKFCVFLEDTRLINFTLGFTLCMLVTQEFNSMPRVVK